MLAAVGAGLDMALMCDVRIAGENASMSESYFNAGIVPGDGGAYFLPRLVGRDKALDLFWTARTLKGKEAADMGLVTHCVPDAELDAFVEQYMEKLLAAPQQAMRLTKRAVVQGEQSSLRASLDLISSFMGIVTELDDYRQRTSALVAKMQRKAHCKDLFSGTEPHLDPIPMTLHKPIRSLRRCPERSTHRNRSVKLHLQRHGTAPGPEQLICKMFRSSFHDFLQKLLPFSLHKFHRKFHQKFP